MLHAATIPSESGLGQPLPIRLSRIIRFEGQPRTFFPKAGIEALAESIMSERQEQAIKVTPQKGQPGTFILIDGERRWRAFHRIHEITGKEPLVNAIVEMVFDLKEHFRKSTLANLHREDLNPLDEAAAYARLKADGETIEGLCKFRGKSKSYIDGYLKLYTLPDEVKVLMDPDLPKDEQLTVTQAIDIARAIPVTAVELRISLAKEAVERNLGVAETRSLIELRTGKAGFRAGGRLRKPSDDYKVLSGFLARTKKTGTRFLRDLDIDYLYLNRDDEEHDRRKDTFLINEAITALEKLRDQIEKK